MIRINKLWLNLQIIKNLFVVSSDWVSGCHFQSVVSWRNACMMICTIGACREYECMVTSMGNMVTMLLYNHLLSIHKSHFTSRQ